LWEAVLGKFFARLDLPAALALALTFPIWLTVNYLGSPTRRDPCRLRSAACCSAGGFSPSVVHVRADAQPGDCLHPGCRRLLCAFLLAGFPLVLDVFSQLVRPRRRSLTHRLAVISHALRDPLPREVIDIRGFPLLRDADRLLPACDRDRTRRAQS